MKFCFFFIWESINYVVNSFADIQPLSLDEESKYLGHAFNFFLNFLQIFIVFSHLLSANEWNLRSYFQ